jgi:hypothetical protein
MTYRIILLLFFCVPAICNTPQAAENPMQASPVIISSSSYDLPYYMGLVSAEGSNTANDGYWFVGGGQGWSYNSDAGTMDQEFDAADGAIAVYVMADADGYILSTEMFYNGSGWSLGRSSIYSVDADTLSFYGYYTHEEGTAELFAKALQYPRSIAADEDIVFQGEEADDNEKFSVTYRITETGITLGGDTCIRTTETLNEDHEVQSMMSVLCPGKGWGRAVIQYWETSDGGDIMGDTNINIVNNIVDSGTGAPFYNSFMDASTITAISTAFDSIKSELPTQSTTPLEESSSSSGNGTNRIAIVPLI